MKVDINRDTKTNLIMDWSGNYVGIVLNPVSFKTNSNISTKTGFNKFNIIYIGRFEIGKI